MTEPLTPQELEEARLVGSLDDEIALLRVITRRLFEKFPDDGASPDQALKYLDKIGKMCFRIGRLSLNNYKMKGEPGPDFESLLRIEWD